MLFIDGVRRIEGRVWIIEDDAAGRARPGLCASYAAGSVLCRDSDARVSSVEVSRGLFTSARAEPIATRHATYSVRATAGDGPEDHQVALQERMGQLEVKVAIAAREADLIVIDGPLRGRQHISGAVGYIKTHRVAYLPPDIDLTIGQLKPGQRTPLFLMTTSWSRYSWYLRLPGAEGHPWAGVVRCETSADAAVVDSSRIADSISLALPRFASKAHKDPRAPQNLYPIAGLERELRRRLGDPALLYRSLLIASQT